MFCVLHQYLFSCLVFCELCLSCGFVLTASLLWTNLVQVCRLFLLCIDDFWVGCIVISVTVWLHSSWRLFPEVYGWWLYLPLWQSSNDEIFLNHVVCLMLLHLCYCIFFFLWLYTKQTWVLSVAIQVWHLLLLSIQCQYNLTNMVTSATVTAQLPCLLCLLVLLMFSIGSLLPLLLIAQNGMVFIQRLLIKHIIG